MRPSNPDIRHDDTTNIQRSLGTESSLAAPPTTAAAAAAAKAATTAAATAAEAAAAATATAATAAKAAAATVAATATTAAHGPGGEKKGGTDETRPGKGGGVERKGREERKVEKKKDNVAPCVDLELGQLLALLHGNVIRVLPAIKQLALELGGPKRNRGGEGEGEKKVGEVGRQV